MSLQPLNNSASLAYSPPTTGRPATEPPPSRQGANPAPAGDSHVENRVEKKEEEQNTRPTDRKESLHEAANKANHLIEGRNSDLKFTVDKETGIDVVKVIDTKTQEVIRQIPAQEMLDIAKHLDDLQGVLIKEQA